MPDIRYRFIEEGADSVAAAFQTVKRSAQEAVRAQKASAREAGPRRGAQQDAHVKARIAHEKELTRVTRQEEQARVRLMRQAAAAQQRERRAEASARRAELVAHKRAIDQRAREEQRAYTRQRQAMFARRQDLSRQNAAMVGAIGGVIAGKAIDLGGDALSLGGAAVRRQLDLRKQATALSVAGRGAGQTGVDPGLLQIEAQAAASRVRGTKAEDILAAQSRYVAMTGDLSGARGLGTTFANASAATGAKAEDIASMAATLQQKFGINDPKEMQAAIADAIFQGKSGSFELADAASYYSEMGAAGSRFGLDKGALGAKKLGALAQIAKSSTGSGAEASTAVQAMLSDIVSHSDKIKKVTGTNVFTDKSRTKTRDIEDILAGIVKGSKGDQKKLNDIFGERGMRGVSSLIEAFNKGAESAGKGATEAERLAAGEAALRGLFDSTVSAGGDWSEVLKDAKTSTDDFDSSLEKAWGDLSKSIGTAVMPGLDAISKHATTLGAALEPLVMAGGDVVDAFAAIVGLAQKAGLLNAPADEAGSRPENARSDLVAVNTRLGELEELRQAGGGLTASQRAEHRRLSERRIGLRQQVAQFANLYMGTGDASGGGTEFDAAGMLANKPQLGGPSGMDAANTAALNAKKNSLWTTAATFAMAGNTGTTAAIGGMGMFAAMASPFVQAGSAARDAASVNINSDGLEKSAVKLAEAGARLEAAANKLGASRLNLPGFPAVLGMFPQ